MATSAHASLWLELSRNRGKPGQLVVGHTIGQGALITSAGSSLPLFLSSSQQPSTKSDLISVGELVVNEKGNGSTRFRIPQTSSGHYTILVECIPCRFSSAGQKILPVGDLTLVGGQEPVTPPQRDDSSAVPVAVWAGGGFLLTVLGVWLTVRLLRRRSRVVSF